MPSFTGTYPSRHGLIFKGPIAEVLIQPPDLYLKTLKKKQRRRITPIKAKALIDTGATQTVVKQGLLTRLNLPVVSTVPMHAVHSVANCPIYHVNITIMQGPNAAGPRFNLMVAEASLADQEIDCLIGRDILSRAVFIYIGYNNSYTLAI